MANIQKGLAASQIVLFGPIVPLFLMQDRLRGLGRVDAAPPLEEDRLGARQDRDGGLLRGRGRVQGAVRRGARAQVRVGLRRVVSGDPVLLSAARPQARAASTATPIPQASFDAHT